MDHDQGTVTGVSIAAGRFFFFSLCWEFSKSSLATVWKYLTCCQPRLPAVPCSLGSHSFLTESCTVVDNSSGEDRVPGSPAL